MRRSRSPGSCWSHEREWRWLLHDRAALILIFGVPLFAFAVLTAVFSHPVIRELGVVVVDAGPIGDLARLRGGGGGVARVSALSSAPATSRRRRARYAPARPSAPSTCRPISSAI